MNSNKLVSGIILVIIGILFLLLNLGYISFNILFSIFELWPLMLIVVGINILFNKKTIVSIITWILFFIILILHGTYYQNGNNVGKWSRSDIYARKTIETLSGELNLDIGAAKVDIDSEEENLIRTNLEGRELIYKETYKNNKETAILSFESEKYNVVNLGNKGSRYSFNLNKDVIWDLDLNLGAVSGELNLENLQIKTMDLDLGAGNLDIILGSKHNKSNIKIDSGASNLSIVIPKESGIKLKLDTALTKTNIDNLDLIKSGDYYLSPNYEEAITKFEFDIDMGVGKIDFKKD